MLTLTAMKSPNFDHHVTTLSGGASRRQSLTALTPPGAVARYTFKVLEAYSA
jgi:hypothetical protein